MSKATVKRKTKTCNLFCNIAPNVLKGDVARFTTHVRTCLLQIAWIPIDWKTWGRRCAHFYSPLSISAPCYPYLELIKATRKGKTSKQGFEVTPGNRSRSRRPPHKRQRTKRQCQDRLKSRIQVHSFHITVRRVSVSNDDSDGKENGSDWQNNKFSRASRFFVHFFAIVARLRQYDRKMPNFTYGGRREYKKTIFFSFSWTSLKSFRIKLQCNLKELTTKSALSAWGQRSLACACPVAGYIDPRFCQPFSSPSPLSL